MSVQSGPRRRFFTEGCLGHVIAAVIIIAVPLAGLIYYAVAVAP